MMRLSHLRSRQIRDIAAFFGLIAIVAIVAGTLVAPGTAHGATFTVNSTNDVDDGTCNATHCSLREAINVANATGGPDLIAFNIGGGGIQTIAVTVAPPFITGPVTIDGRTQPGYVNTPLINLSGTSAIFGLRSTAAVQISGLSITSFSQGVQLHVGADGSVLTANWIGYTPTSVEAPNVTIGVFVFSDNNVIGGTSSADRNVISASESNLVMQGSAGNLIQGNYIGTNPAGTAAPIATQRLGISISALTTSDNNTIGGLTPGARNVISGHSDATFGFGINSDGGGPDNWTIAGNYIGLSADGTFAIPNNVGISYRSGTNFTIGGATSSARNVVSGNLKIGIRHGPPTGGATIQNNYIGVAADGVTAIGNGSGLANQGGIQVEDGSADIFDNTIAYSTGDGVFIEPGASAQSERNAIFLNDLLGIDVGDDGTTASPVTLFGATTNPGITTVTGQVLSIPNATVLVDYYDSPACDPSTNGEGARWLASQVVPLSGAGFAPLTFVTPAVTPGHVVTATMTFGGTSEFSNCVTVAGCGGGSADCDSFADTAATNHTGPTNASTSVDNCPVVWNQPQVNTDGNFNDNSPPYAGTVDDKTWPNSDAQGDECDADDDNDGLSDSVERGLPFAPCPTASGPTNPLLRDTDGDRFLDRAECALGTDPASAASKPAVAACGGTTDADGDKLTERIEVCFYGTNPNNSDTDGDKALDGGKDGCEAASFNPDRIVNVADMGMLASAISNVTFRIVNIDVNKDGVWNPADQGLVASFISPSGQCPG